MNDCNPRGPLVIHITKLFPKQDCSRFDAFGRILSGSVRPGDKVRTMRLSLREGWRTLLSSAMAGLAWLGSAMAWTARGFTFECWLGS